MHNCGKLVKMRCRTTRAGSSKSVALMKLPKAKRLLPVRLNEGRRLRSIRSDGPRSTQHDTRLRLRGRINIQRRELMAPVRPKRHLHEMHAVNLRWNTNTQSIAARYDGASALPIITCLSNDDATIKPNVGFR